MIFVIKIDCFFSGIGGNEYNHPHGSEQFVPTNPKQQPQLMRRGRSNI